MKKYFCDRCGISLTDEKGRAIPHYNMKDSKSRHLRKSKKENFVCVPCVDIKTKSANNQ